MDNIHRKFYFEPQLLILYRSFRVLGLIHFRFNPATQRFERSRPLLIASLTIYNCIRCMYGLLIFSYILEMLLAYAHPKIVHYEFSSVGAQDDFLEKCCWVKEYLTAMLFATNYLRVRHILLPTINELVDIHHIIHEQTDARLYVDASLTTVLFLKVCITCCRLKLPVFANLITSLLFHNFLWFFAFVIPELTFASCVFGQLFLISVYLKMNELLEASDYRMKRRERRKLVENLVSLSHRIHCVKQKLNDIYKPVLVTTFIGAMFDINKLYFSLKILFYSKYNRSVRSVWTWFCKIGFPECISYTFDTYLIGLLSDTLLRAEDDFRDLLMSVSNKCRLYSRDVEVALFHSNVFGLGTVALGRLKVDQQFAFDYAINLVLNFALTCLQFYAGEEVYATGTAQ